MLFNSCEMYIGLGRTAFCTCINGSRLFCPVQDVQHCVIWYVAHYSLLWFSRCGKMTFRRGSNGNRRYMSGNKLCIPDLACFKCSSHFGKDSKDTSCLASCTKFCFSLQTSFLSIISAHAIIWAYSPLPSLVCYSCPSSLSPWSRTL